ncbi:MAG: hypothetical protein AAF242_21085, partial [Bacteroidota bacterium]
MFVAWSIFSFHLVAQKPLQHQFILQEGSVKTIKLYPINADEAVNWQFYTYDTSRSHLNLPPIFGKLNLKNDTLIFIPFIALQANYPYQVRQGDQTIHTFTTPKLVNHTLPQLVSYTPFIDTIPANLLKVYLHFSMPMQEGKSAEYVNVVQKQGDTLHGIFLDLQPELWNEDYTRLTLWVDPGRLKRALASNDLKGKPLMAGSEIIIKIAQSWENQQGSPLESDYLISYHIIEEDRRSPNTKQITYSAPGAGTKETFLLQMHEAFDAALLQRMVSITDAQKRELLGNLKTNQQANQVQFVP